MVVGRPRCTSTDAQNKTDCKGPYPFLSRKAHQSDQRYRRRFGRHMALLAIVGFSSSSSSSEERRAPSLPPSVQCAVPTDATSTAGDGGGGDDNARICREKDSSEFLMTAVHFSRAHFRRKDTTTHEPRAHKAQMVRPTVCIRGFH